MEVTRRMVLGAAAFSSLRVQGANDRLGMALIGAGRRGREVMKAFLDAGVGELRAVADVYDAQRDRARAMLGAAPLEAVAHEEVLARADVEAVLIATPDHWHLNIAKAALAAGKHVYLEKPAVHWEREGAELAAAVKASGKMLQVGTQQRSGEHYRRAKQEIFAEKKLGEIRMVRANWSNFPWQARRIAAQPKPAGLDWNRFVGPAPRRDYEWARYDAWRYYRDYGGGVLADILNHWADVAQWMMNDANPKEAAVLGGIYQLRDGRENPDTVNAVIQYEGWNLSFESTVLPVRDDRPTVLFLGTEGTLDLSRAGYTFTPHKASPRTVAAAGNLEQEHARDFASAITRSTPLSAPMAVGMEGLRPCFLARASYWNRNESSSTRSTNPAR